MINYSIIIPHKDIPDLLKRCLNSIPQRNDLQILVIDDNSSNENILKLKQIVTDKNVEIIYTTQNKGAGYARNIGLKNAKGKWLIFADADDYFTKNFDNALEKYADNENELIYFKIKADSYCNDINFIEYWESYINNKIDDYKKNKNNDELLYKIGNPWAKFFKKEFAINNKIYFDEIPWGNDIFFVSNFIINGPSITTSDIDIYCYYQRENSLSIKKEYTREEIICRFNVAFKQYKTLKIKNKQNYIFDFIKNLWLLLFKNNKKKALIYLLKIKKRYKTKEQKKEIKLLLENNYEFIKCIKYPRYILGKIKKIFTK